MKSLIILIAILMILVINTDCNPETESAKSVEPEAEVAGEAALHYGYDTENGQHRTEDLKYQKPNPEESLNGNPVEYRGGYSFISADGYEYKVLYKANANGFQPYVTAHKIKKPAA